MSVQSFIDSKPCFPMMQNTMIIDMRWIVQNRELLHCFDETAIVGITDVLNTPYKIDSYVDSFIVISICRFSLKFATLSMNARRTPTIVK